MRLTSHLPLFWTICLINGVVFVVGALLLVVSPASVSSDPVPSEIVVIGIGLTVMLLADVALIRWALAPLHRLIARLEGIEQLAPTRLPEEGSGAVRGIAAGVNELLLRLAEERRAGDARALAAQEAERHRIAQELHDEVGQSLTVVLLGLKQVESRAPADLVEDLAAVRESARTGLDDVRRVARRLRPGVLEDLGLTSALAALATDFTDHSAADVRRSFAPGLPTLQPGGRGRGLPGRPGGADQRRAARGGPGGRAVAAATGQQRGAGGARRRPRLHRPDRGLGPDGHARARSAGQGRAVGDQPAAARDDGAAEGARRDRGGGRMIRILLADDHTLVRRGVRLILEQEPDLEVVAEAADGVEAVERVRDTEVDLVVLDIAMPRMTGLQAASEIARRREPPRILMLSMHDNEQYFFGALKAGATGYVLKSVADEDLVGACRSAMRGETFLYPGAESTLVRDYLDRLQARRAGADVGAHGPRGPGHQAHRRGPLVARDRPRPAHRAEDGRGPPRQHPRQARHARPGRADPLRDPGRV